jgi:hypothetical protein
MAQFGIKKPAAPAAPAAGGGVTAADIDALLADASAARSLVQQANWATLEALGSKEQLDKLRAEQDATKKIADPKEREAKQKALDAKVSAQTKESAEKADAGKLENLDNEKKSKLSAGIWNLTLGLLKDTDLVTRATQISTSPPSPTIASRLPAVKDLVVELKDQVKHLTGVTGNLKKLSKVAKLDKLPASSTEQPKPMS